jgi:hypothetical protein
MIKPLQYSISINEHNPDNKVALKFRYLSLTLTNYISLLGLKEYSELKKWTYNYDMNNNTKTILLS